MSEWIAIEDGCVWPKAETIVEVKLHNGFVGLAMFDCNIQDAGDWDLVPLDEYGKPTMDSVADQAFAWREATALDRLSGRVTVKPLEWEETSPGRYLAVAPFNIGRYVVDQNPGNGAPGWLAPGPDEDWQIMNSLDAAKAAAQADFEARILAAIDTAPAPSPDQIRREALTLIERLYCIEGKDAEWRAERMNSVAREAQSPEPNLSRFHRIFPRSVFTGGDDD